MKKYIIGIVVIGFFAWFGWQLYAHKNTKQEAEQYAVQKGKVVETVSASGEVKPIEYANLSFSAPALVKQINADVGDEVKKGDKLIILDRSALLSDIYAMRLEVEKTQAQERLARRNWDDYKPEEKEQIIKNSQQARTRLSSTQAQLLLDIPALFTIL
jgi:multidrug efflux pump subunit AcrA (membrane-fusion protein)